MILDCIIAWLCFRIRLEIMNPDVSLTQKIIPWGFHFTFFDLQIKLPWISGGYLIGKHYKILVLRKFARSNCWEIVFFNKQVRSYLDNYEQTKT